MNTDRGYDDPKIRHHMIQVSGAGEMYIAEVDVYLQWRIQRTIRGDPEKTIKAASLNVAKKATAFLMDMLQKDKETNLENLMYRQQNEKVEFEVNSGDRSLESPTIEQLGHMGKGSIITSSVAKNDVSINHMTKALILISLSRCKVVVIVTSRLHAHT